MIGVYYNKDKNILQFIDNEYVYTRNCGLNGLKSMRHILQFYLHDIVCCNDI